MAPKNKQLERVYFDPKMVASYGGVNATRHARAEENRRRMVVGTGRLCPTQTDENSFQETTRRRGRSTSAVAGRSSRFVEFQKLQ